MNVSETDRVSCDRPRVRRQEEGEAARNRRGPGDAARGTGAEADAEATDALGHDELEMEAEELVAEEFEDAEDGAITEE